MVARPLFAVVLVIVLALLACSANEKLDVTPTATDSAVMTAPPATSPPISTIIPATLAPTQIAAPTANTVPTTTIPTQPPSPTAIPKANADRWAITGYVEFSDGTPGYKTKVLLRDAPINPEFEVYGLISSEYADNDGRYFFDLDYLADLLERSMAGTFYLNVVENGTYSDEPDIIITVEQDVNLELTETLFTRNGPTTTIPTQPSSPTPIPKAISDRWGITGYVEFSDGTPGYKTKVLLRDAPINPEFEVYGLISSEYADTNGRYFFDLDYLADLLERSMAGTFYLNVVENNTYSDEPDIIITVKQDVHLELTETLFTRKELDISLGRTRTAKLPGCSYCRKTVIDGPNPLFSWTEVPNASEYEVELWSTYTDRTQKNREYTRVLRVPTNEIEWIDNLSALSYNEFRLDVSAHSSEGLLIASNYELFCVDECDGDWYVP